MVENAMVQNYLRLSNNFRFSFHISDKGKELE